MTARVLAVYAHPDDESFMGGGTLAESAARGFQVTLVCATRGEVGEISDPSLATRDTLPKVREAELRASSVALGIGEPRFLGYRDSGMDGTPENDDPRCLYQASSDEVTYRLVALMRELKPHVVITFEPNGVYGHPDHIAISRYTTAAYDACSDPAVFPDAGPAWQPQCLFYSALPRSFFAKVRNLLKRAGIDTSEFDSNLNVEQWPFDDDQITHSVDVTPHIDAKWRSLKAHRTQFGTENFITRMPRKILHEIMQHEFFMQARPALTLPKDTPRLTNLFEGLRVAT